METPLTAVTVDEGDIRGENAVPRPRRRLPLLRRNFLAWRAYPVEGVTEARKSVLPAKRRMLCGATAVVSH